MSEDSSDDANHVGDESSSDTLLLLPGDTPVPTPVSDYSSSRRNGECTEDDASLKTDKSDESSEQFLPSPEGILLSPEEMSVSSDDPSAEKNDESKKSSGSSELPSTAGISEGIFSTPEEKSRNVDSPEDQNEKAGEDTKPPIAEQELSASTESIGFYGNYYDYADSDDSRSVNVEKCRAIMESFEEVKKPKRVDVGKVVCRKRNLSGITHSEDDVSPSQFESTRLPKRRQFDSSRDVALPLQPTSSESSQETTVRDESLEFSSRLFPLTKSETSAPAEEVKPGERQSVELKGSGKKKDYRKAAEVTETSSKYSGDKISAEDSEDTVDYELSGELTSNLVVSQGVVIVDTPESPPPSSTRQEASVQCKVYPTTASSRFRGDSLERTINNLTDLIDRIVVFTNQMEAHSLFSVPGPAPRRFSAEELAPAPGPSSRPTLRELEEDFQRGFRALIGEVVDEDEATGVFKRSVREMRDHLRQAADGMSRHSPPVETVPASAEPVTLQELREFLPRLLEMAQFNNVLLKQWASTLLDWCLHPIPELLPQQFYDSEAGIREFYYYIKNVHRSVARLMGRWRSRRMDYNELGDLAFLMSLASTAASLFNTLESEVTNIRYYLGTRRRSSRSEKASGQNSPKSKKDANRNKKGKKD